MSDPTPGCPAKVLDPLGWHSYPCQNRATRDGWCGVHHPDAAKKREEKQAARWQERDYADARKWQREAVGFAYCYALDAG